MPDTRRLQRDRQRAPLDLMLTWARLPAARRNQHGEWTPGSPESARIWGRLEDPETLQSRALDHDGVRLDGERVYTVRYDGRMQPDDSLIDAAGTVMRIIEIEPIGRRRWLRLRCVEQAD